MPAPQKKKKTRTHTYRNGVGLSSKFEGRIRAMTEISPDIGGLIDEVFQQRWTRVRDTNGRPLYRYDFIKTFDSLEAKDKWRKSMKLKITKLRKLQYLFRKTRQKQKSLEMAFPKLQGASYFEHAVPSNQKIDQLFQDILQQQPTQQSTFQCAPSVTMSNAQNKNLLGHPMNESCLRQDLQPEYGPLYSEVQTAEICSNQQTSQSPQGDLRQTIELTKDSTPNTTPFQSNHHKEYKPPGITAAFLSNRQTKQPFQEPFQTYTDERQFNWSLSASSNTKALSSTLKKPPTPLQWSEDTERNSGLTTSPPTLRLRDEEPSFADLTWTRDPISTMIPVEQRKFGIPLPDFRRDRMASMPMTRTRICEPFSDESLLKMCEKIAEKSKLEALRKTDLISNSSLGSDIDSIIMSYLLSE